VGSEYFINSQELEDKVRNLLPSQGGAGAGFDLSASTQIIPIIDLTESAEGSNVRQDLQTALSFDNVTPFLVTNTTSTIVSTTGYFRLFGNCTAGSPTGNQLSISITDGTTSKIIFNSNVSGFLTNVGGTGFIPFDFIVFVGAGDSITASSNTTGGSVVGITRQIADIDGNLV